jgi:thiamine biosynthesis lipoprotein
VDVAGLHPAKDKPLYRLNLRNAFVSTSGDAERFAEIDGKRYAHIVDPKTGLGVTRRATVTVVSQDGAAADAFATSLYLLGVQGDDLLGRLAGAPPLAVSWMEVMDDGRLELKTNPAFDRIAKP